MAAHLRSEGGPMDLWSRTRDTFVSRLEEQAKSLGLLTEKQGVGHVSGDWMAVKCPLCTDSGGSASLSVKSGHLNCRQCGANDPLFDWLQKRSSFPSAWDACKDLAQNLGIDMPKPGRERKNVLKISKGTLDTLVADLWEHENAEQMRSALALRGFTQSELSKYFLGFDGAALVFPRVDVDGEVHSRAHRWHGPNAKPKWSWNRPVTGGESPNYYWPANCQPKGHLWICEGEWDCLILREKLGQEAITWTGGVTSSPSAAQVPDWIRGLTVTMVCDNDSWQGAGKEWAPNDRAVKDLRARRLRFLEHCRVISRFAAKVEIATVPIGPEEIWGGDIRDWYEKGGRILDEMERISLEDAMFERVVYVPCNVRQAASRPEQHVEFVAGVAGIDSRHDLWRPDYTVCDCAIGTLKACQQCRLPHLNPEGIIHWDQDQHMKDLLACAMTSRDPTRFIEKHIVGRPRSCPLLTLRHSKDGAPVTVWLAEDRDSSIGTELKVISDQLPPMSEEMKVRGRVIANVEGMDTLVVARESRVAKVDKIDLSEIDGQLKYLCPHKSNDQEVINKYLDQRWADLTTNVTKIANPAMVRLFDLTVHSARRFKYRGDLIRGWLDTCLLGVTRCGKTETVTRLFEHFGGVGYRASTQGNFSIAGLVAGNQKGRDGNYRIVPGVFPRQHKRIVILDEAHLMADVHRYGSVVSNLQEIRDHGIAESIKVAGQHKLPAEVRLMLIGNPPRGLFENYMHKCEAFAELYGDTPEFVSRMDLGWCVTQEDSNAAAKLKPDPYQVAWSKEICSAFRQRAWELEPEDIVFDDDVWELVEKTMQGWTEVCDQELPLFSGPDKANSLIRVAIAVANLCYSHDRDNSKCVVRRAHVEVAVQIIEDFWQHCDYYAYSSRKNIGIGDMIWVAEFGLIHRHVVTSEAVTLLGALLGTNSKIDLQTITGMPYHQIDGWVSRMFGARVLMMRKNRLGSGYAPTKEGAKLIHKLINLAINDEATFHERRRKLHDYFLGDPLKFPAGAFHGLDSLLDEDKVPF